MNGGYLDSDPRVCFDASGLDILSILDPSSFDLTGRPVFTCKIGPGGYVHDSISHSRSLVHDLVRWLPVHKNRQEGPLLAST